MNKLFPLVLAILLPVNFSRCSEISNSMPFSNSDDQFQNESIDQIIENTKNMEQSIPVPVDPLAAYEQTKATVLKNSTASAALSEAGLSPQQIHNLVVNTKPVYKLSSVRPGTEFVLYWNKISENEKQIVEVHYGISAIETLIAKYNPQEDNWNVKINQKQITSQVRTFQSTVESSLWNSAYDAGAPAEIISALSDTFAWQIDFSREVRVGDKWRIVVEELLVDGENYGWGKIYGAEYINEGESYTAFLFEDNAQRRKYYDKDGDSLKKLFLKSPVKFSRISSRFTKARYHPILKINRPHNGVDYAAGTGTPVYAVGDGKVVMAEYRGGSGKMVKIRHNSTYDTSYLHLNGFAKGIKRGAKVEQGQVIGYVGSTGLATGPHLHFEFTEKGRYVDPQGLKFPAADPVSKQDLVEFKVKAQEIMAMLPKWENTKNNTDHLVLEKVEISRVPNSLETY